ncbi:hypothetical protein PF001_g18241 [Phytophthora fragariae]|uniref:Uncharacterized protein n=1 Tax=Phytophthora fragariae TaxID=53985 RepID=A0A6A4CQQ7_9STRA|nr:hypothetical protein PF001_g18241 [Phytophthora fragariae]
MRQELSVKEATSGLEVLDNIAEAILDDTGKAGDAFSEAKISKTLRDNKYELPTVASFDPKEAKASGFTPIVSDHGSYTAIWKSGTADDDEKEEEEDGSVSEEDDSEEDKPPPPKKPKPSRSSSDSSGDGTTTL